MYVLNIYYDVLTRSMLHVQESLTCGIKIVVECTNFWEGIPRWVSAVGSLVAAVERRLPGVMREAHCYKR